MRITLATWQALGDTIVSLPVAFHLEAQGHEVAIVNTRGRGVPQSRQYIQDLPTYPIFASKPWGRVITLRKGQKVDPVNGDIDDGPPVTVPIAYGRVVDLTTGAAFGWRIKEPLCNGIAAAASQVLEDTPRVPILAHPFRHEELAAALTGSTNPYVLVAVEGSSSNRALTERQVQAVCKDWRAVLVHHERREFDGCPTAVNLTGRTSLPDLVTLVAGAMAVVSVDTGAWHLAPAMMVPTLGVVSDTSAPEALAGYQPTAYLRSLRGIDRIPPELLASSLEQVILSAPLTATPKPPIGLRWWETAEVQTRLNSAAAHQTCIDAAFGGGHIVEVP